MSAVPKAALRALDRGALCYLAVPTSRGPHLTPLVYAVHAGRLWVTTSRSSVKARAWRAGAEVAGMVRHGDVAVTFRGTVTTYDAFDPLSWPGAALAAPRIARAGTKFSLKNARFFAGYAVDAGRVPLSWMPPGRVFAAVRLTAGWVIGAREGVVLEGWGSWTRGADHRAGFRALPRRRGVDRRVPSAVRAQVGESGEGALALDAAGHLTVLPVAWRRVPSEGTYDGVLPEATLALSAAFREAPAALTVDRASAWRAADMAGMLLRGRAELFSPGATTRGRAALRQRIGSDDPNLALVRLRPERAVWWRGWESGTVSAMAGAAS